MKLNLFIIVILYMLGTSSLMSQHVINTNTIKGGMHIVNTLNDRDNIPINKRMLGMLVWVNSERRLFRLWSPTLGNDGWYSVNENVDEANGSAQLSADGDSIRVTLQKGTTNGNVLVSWGESGYLGDIGIRNVTNNGFTIFSNTDELNSIKVIYLILDYKLNVLP